MTDIFVYTSKGGRDSNEDFVGCAYSADGAVAALCDGLGGEGGGDIASRIAADVIVDEPYDTDDDRKWLADRINLADERIKKEQTRLNNRMKSTVVALKITGSKAVWAHAGDSRLYYIHDSAIAEVTADHTVAFKKYLAGEITRGEIASDEDRNSLLNCIGIENFRVEYGSAEIVKGDAFMLCCDGLWENLQDQEILFDYLKATTAERWAELMLLRAVDRMEADGDNLSVITVIID